MSTTIARPVTTCGSLQTRASLWRRLRRCARGPMPAAAVAAAAAAAAVANVLLVQRVLEMHVREGTAQRSVESIR